MKICKAAITVLSLLGLICPGAIWSMEIALGVVTKPGAAQNVCAEKFRELVEARLPHKVRIYDSGSLGAEAEILKKIQKGSIHMGIITSGSFNRFVPGARVIDYPYLFGNYEQVDRVLEGPMGQKLPRMLEKAGFKGLAFSENGFRHLTNSRRPVHGVEEVAGLIVDEKPDIASFRKKASGIDELGIFQAKDVRKLLLEFQEAVAGTVRK